jgi:predicted secreted protein
VKDQQAAGVCWSFAISSIMDNAARRAGRADVFAPLHIISNDEWNLLWTQGAGHTIVAEGSWPYDPHKACELDRYTANEQYCSSAYNVTPGSWNSDPPLVAQRAQAESLGAFKIIAFHPLKKQPASIDEIVDVLAGGQAIFADVDINIGAWSYSRGFDATGLIPDWEGDGGHAVEIAGYRTVSGQRQFLVHNSWGVSWGDGGYAWISEKMMRERLQEGFVVSVGDASGRPLQGAVTPTTLGVEDDGKTVPLKKGQDLILSLTSNPSTGLDWVLKSDGGLGPPKSEFVPANDDPDTVGGRGRRTFTWAATAPTDARSPRVIELEYKRAGDATTPPVKTFKATITFAD